jgi:pseudouridine-5'-phosphate glycosidase/pseudouridine kinase
MSNPSTPPETSSPIPTSSPESAASSIPNIHKPADVIVAGALAVDFSCDFAPITGSPDQTDPSLHTSNPAVINQTLGGVGHNIARAVHLLGPSVQLCSAIGDDLSGRAALSQLESQSMQTSGIKILLPPNRTAQYVSVNNAHKDLTLAMADMSILESSTPSSITATWLNSPSITQKPSKYVIVDANWTSECLHTWLTYARSINANTIFEPVSAAKSARLFFSPTSNAASTTPVVDIATPNKHELTALHNHAYEHSLFNSASWFRIIDALGIPSSGLRVPLAHATSSALVDTGVPQQAIKLLPFIPTILTKLGPDGVLLTQLLKPDDAALCSADEAPYVLARNTNGDTESGVGGLYVRLYKPEKVLGEGEVVSVNGIGDTFVGALAAGLVSGRQVRDVVGFAQKAAGLSLRSKESVSPELVHLRGEING